MIIDGIFQLPHPHTVVKPASYQHAPSTPNWDRETAQALEHNGLPPLEPTHRTQSVVFTNVSRFWSRTPESVVDLLAESAEDKPQPSGIVVVQGGQVVCFGRNSSCDSYHRIPNAEIINLHGGAFQPGLVAYGTGLGLTEIPYEASTSDGYVKDPLDGQPALFGSGGYIARAVDGLQFGTRDALLAYRAGVTVSVTSPSHQSWLSGLSTAFSLGAAHKLERGAVVSDVVAVHVSLSHGDSEPSLSTKIAAMRRLLMQETKGEVGEWFGRVVNVSPFLHFPHVTLLDVQT